MNLFELKLWIGSGIKISSFRNILNGLYGTPLTSGHKLGVFQQKKNNKPSFTEQRE